MRIKDLKDGEIVGVETVEVHRFEKNQYGNAKFYMDVFLDNGEIIENVASRPTVESIISTLFQKGTSSMGVVPMKVVKCVSERGFEYTRFMDPTAPDVNGAGRMRYLEKEKDHE